MARDLLGAPAMTLETRPVTSSRLVRPLARAVVTAPMRVSFAGGGSDLPPFVPGVGGLIVGTAIDLRVRVAVEPFDRGWVKLVARAGEASMLRRRSDAPRRDPEWRLLEAALAAAGVDDAVRVEVDTEILPGAGLGGSGAAAVAALCALHTATGKEGIPEDLIGSATRLERDGLGLSCGAQDPAFAACGGSLVLAFDDRGHVSRRPLVVPPEMWARFASGILLIDTRTRRVSGAVLARAQASAVERAVPELVAAARQVERGFAAGDLDAVLAGMRRSAAAKVLRDRSASAVALDLQDRLGARGAEVVRACGAGAGGHVLVWAPPERHAEIAALASPWLVRTPRLSAPGVRAEP